MPFTLKDMIEAAGIGASVGTRASERMPEHDSVIAQRLQAAGAILLGKTNMSNALQTNSEQFGRSSNPYDTGRTTGGSSGGAVAAVARVSRRSTWNRLVRVDPNAVALLWRVRLQAHAAPDSRGGLAFGPPGIPRMDRTLAAAGPLARTAADVALLFRVLAGPDPRDPDVPPVPTAEVPAIAPRDLRVAIAPSIKGIKIAREIREALEKLAVRLSDAGVHVEEREPLPFEDLLPAFRRTLLASLGIAIRAGIAPPGMRSMNLPESTPFDVMVALDAAGSFHCEARSFLRELRHVHLSGCDGGRIYPPGAGESDRGGRGAAVVDVRGPPDDFGDLHWESVAGGAGCAECDGVADWGAARGEEVGR